MTKVKTNFSYHRVDVGLDVHKACSRYCKLSTRKMLVMDNRNCLQKSSR